tara:strand:- start:172 stop:384 length:213 start_codon:yes stop_codon:yes gene_type:complete
MLLVGMCLLITLLKLGDKSSQIDTLQERLGNQELYIKDIYIKTNYLHVDSLYIEIMNLGAQLDSMKIKYD